MVPHLVYQFQINCFRELKLLVETKCKIDRYTDRRTLVKLNTPMSGGGGHHYKRTYPWFGSTTIALGLIKSSDISVFLFVPFNIDT